MKTLPAEFELETERLRLRGPREEDIAFVFDATRYPGFNDGMLWDAPETIDACRPPYEEAVRAWRAGEMYAFTIALRGSAELVGRIALRESGCGISVGFWTHPKHQNHGYLTEALREVLRLAFEQLHAPSVEACHAEWNLASRRVLEKCGFRFKRHVEEGFQKKGEWVPEDILSISQRQWQADNPRASSVDG